MQGLTAATVDTETTPLPSGRVERRRGVVDDIADPDTIAPSFDPTKLHLRKSLLASYARSRLAGSPAMAALILLAAGLASAWLPSASVVVWSLVALCSHALLGVLCLSYRKREAMDTRLWSGLFLVAECLCGLSWVGILVLLSAEHGPEAAVFQFAILLAVACAATALAAALPEAVIAATAPAALTLVALFAFREEPLLVALAWLSGATAIFFVCLSVRERRSIRDGILARAEHARLYQELLVAREQAEHALQLADQARLARSRFLATMNHELRTPLNAILGFSEVMKNEVLGPMQNGTYREYAGDIHASGGHLLSLINEILDLSRLETGRYELHEVPVALEAIVRACESMVAGEARSRELRLVLEIEPDLPLVRADPAGLRRAVLNLLSNAVKFTPAGGTVTLQAGWTAGGGQYVSVRDTGPGIPAREVALVLSPFQQGESAIHMAKPGAGMGLPMVEALIRLHGGTFELRSTMGAGTVATLCLPRARVLETQSEDVPARENVILWRSAG
ncbi:sensor histidine kinase [Kaistia sp. UC242_56]|uniref:sensor histidine kinase n=1 Tax=Kaistia sp. UC242_56 TaxID=3374625 RepID=UPI0037A484C1